MYSVRDDVMLITADLFMQINDPANKAGNAQSSYVGNGASPNLREDQDGYWRHSGDLYHGGLNVF